MPSVLARGARAADSPAPAARGSDGEQTRLTPAATRRDVLA